MNQNLSLYRIFYTTARTGNISRAAEELFISQPAVSKSISRLEQSLGTELFTRSSRGVQLTEEGELLYSHVRSAFQTLESAENQLRIRREFGMGQLRIGVSSTLCKYILLPCLKDFVKLHPHLRVTMFLLPMGSGVFLYRALATDIILGSLWKDAAFIIGITAITFAIRTIFVSFNSEVYRAKGKFYMPLCVQLIDLAILIPTCISSSKIGFEALVYARALIRMDMVIPGFILMYVVCKIKPSDTFRNLWPSFVSTGVMFLTALVLQRFSKSVAWSIMSIACCVVIYFSVICLFKNERSNIFGFIKQYCRHKEQM